MKKIWKDFIDVVKQSASECWKQIRTVAKSTFKVFKVALIDFVVAVGVWLKDLLAGIISIIVELLRVVCVALICAVQSTVGLAIEWLLDKIRKF